MLSYKCIIIKNNCHGSKKPFRDPLNFENSLETPEVSERSEGVRMNKFEKAVLGSKEIYMEA